MSETFIRANRKKFADSISTCTNAFLDKCHFWPDSGFSLLKFQLVQVPFWIRGISGHGFDHNSDSSFDQLCLC